MLNYDRRLAPSHPEPVDPTIRRADSLRSSLYGAILHSEDKFKMSWALNRLRFKVDKEMQEHKFDKSQGVCGVVHVLHLKSRTATAIKVGCSSYPTVFGGKGAIRRYKNVFTPMSLKKVEAISLYQTPRRAFQVEQELHKQLRAKFGNVNPHDVKSRELYKVEDLDACLRLLREIEQRPALSEITRRPKKSGDANVLKRKSL